MKLRRPFESAFTLIEIMVTGGIIGVVGVMVLSMLNIGMILGAKNTAVNTAHQQARTAMLQMVADIHSAISLPYLVDVNNNQLPASTVTAAPGIGFQLYSMGPGRVSADAAVNATSVQIKFPASITTVPAVGQRLIVPTHSIETDISAVAPLGSNTYTLTLANGIPNAIQGTAGATNYNIVCFITDRCSYRVINGALSWWGPTTKNKLSDMGDGITNPNPFTTPVTAAGAYDYKFIAAVNLSTTDTKYSNRGFKSANILLNGRVPARTRLTTYQ